MSKELCGTGRAPGVGDLGPVWRVFLRRYCREHLVPAALAADAVLIADELAW